jgi:hypothetical protein
MLSTIEPPFTYLPFLNFEIVRVIHFTLCGILISHSFAAAMETPPIELPADPKTVVISLDYRGAGPGPGRWSDEPYLVIRADGTATAHNPYGQRVAKDEGIVEARELQELLQFAVQECSFFECDDEQLRKIIAEHTASKKLAEAADAGYAIIRIRTRDKDHEVRLYPVSPWNRSPWPDDEQLTLMREMDSFAARLENVFAKLTVSNPKELSTYLQIANDHLKDLHPEQPPLEAEHFHRARRSFASTNIAFCGPAKEPDRFVVVYMEIPKQGPPEVHINIRK